jgi:hypothetical protein
MRNLEQYPVTDDEIIRFLRSRLEFERANAGIGGMGPLLMMEAISRVARYPEPPKYAKDLAGDVDVGQADQGDVNTRRFRDQPDHENDGTRDANYRVLSDLAPYDPAKHGKLIDKKN